MDSCPPEILENILSNLDARDVANSRRISRTMRNVIDGSLSLQYRIECFLARVVDNPARRDVGLRERIDRVRGWREAFDSCRWSENKCISISLAASNNNDEDEDDGTVVRVTASGPAYVLQVGRSITIIQPPSTYRGRIERRWVINDSGFVPAAFTYNPYQQVLALAEKIDEQNYNIRLLAVTGDPHPSASVPVLSVSIPEGEVDLDTDSTCYIELYHDLLMVKVDRFDDFGDHEIWIFNWKTGTALLNLYGYMYDFSAPCGVAFLDCDHILLPIRRSHQEDGPFDEAGIAVIGLHSALSERQLALDAVRGASRILLLPELLEDAEYDPLFVFGRPPPIEQEASALGEIFLHRSDNSLVGIAFGAFLPHREATTYRHCMILLMRDYIRSLLPQTKDPSHTTDVAWEHWAPYTRVFPSSGLTDGDDTGQPPVLASKCFIKPLIMGQLEDRSPLGTPGLAVFDFMPRELHKLLDASVSQEANMVEPGLWSNPICTGARLSYRGILIASPFKSHSDHHVVGEDFLVVTRSTSNTTVDVQTYWI